MLIDHMTAVPPAAANWTPNPPISPGNDDCDVLAPEFGSPDRFLTELVMASASTDSASSKIPAGSVSAMNAEAARPEREHASRSRHQRYYRA